MPIPENLLDIICCPTCKGDLEYDKKKDILICRNCKVYFEIIEDIPVLIPSEAKPLNETPDSR
ncbi:MAG: Trm112 family protein [candidate division WOR-3 bacterium]